MAIAQVYEDNNSNDMITLIITMLLLIKITTVKSCINDKNKNIISPEILRKGTVKQKLKRKLVLLPYRR